MQLLKKVTFYKNVQNDQKRHENAKMGGVAVYLNTSICGGVDPYRVGTHCKILHFLGYPPFLGFLGGLGVPCFSWFL